MKWRTKYLGHDPKWAKPLFFYALVLYLHLNKTSIIIWSKLIFVQLSIYKPQSSLLVYYTHTHTETLSCAPLGFLWRIRGFVAVGVSDESHWQITMFQTAFKLLPFQSGGALITDNSSHFNKEFWRTRLSFCSSASGCSLCVCVPVCIRPTVQGALRGSRQRTRTNESRWVYGKVGRLSNRYVDPLWNLFVSNLLIVGLPTDACVPLRGESSGGKTLREAF